MPGDVEDHYGRSADLVGVIAESLRNSGKDLDRLSAADLASVDEFHIRGRAATLELVPLLRLTPGARLLDIGSGLGGPARTIAEATGCHVTGIDLTPAFCEAATVLSSWTGLADRVDFRVGDATNLPFAEGTFDAAVTIHVGMNIAARDRMYAEAHRVLRPGGRFVIYDVLQGEGGDVLYPVPWARDPSISYLVTPREMPILLAEAGFTVIETRDTTEESQRWFEELAARMAGAVPAATFRTFLGDDFPVMARNQIANLRDRRIRTVTCVGEA